MLHKVYQILYFISGLLRYFTRAHTHRQWKPRHAKRRSIQHHMMIVTNLPCHDDVPKTSVIMNPKENHHLFVFPHLTMTICQLQWKLFSLKALIIKRKLRPLGGSPTLHLWFVLNTSKKASQLDILDYQWRRRRRKAITLLVVGPLNVNITYWCYRTSLNEPL